MTNVKQDLTLYKELKKVKSEFDKEVKSAKSSINRNNFSEAKTSLSKCEGYINNMESIIDKLPDKSTVDTAKKTLFALVSMLTSIAANMAYFNNEKKWLLDKEKEFADKAAFNGMRLSHIKDEMDSNTRLHIQNKVLKDVYSKDNKIPNLSKSIDEIDSEIKKLDDDYSKLYDKYLDEKKDKESNQKERENITKKLNNIATKSDGALIASGLGVGAIIVSTKPLKQKAKNILKKCNKVLNNTKDYLDKTEKMSKAVKESFDETLDSLYESFTEGTIDEFEYDTLMDHLLN